MLGNIPNWSHPDGSMAQAFLNTKVILFCNDYMVVNVPIGMSCNKQVGRLDGVDHQTRKKNFHVHVNQLNRVDDFVRAHTVVLQHTKVVTPYAKRHIVELKRKYRLLRKNKSNDQIMKEHNRDFLDWFKAYMQANALPDSNDKASTLFSLALGPNMNLVTYQAYDNNGYTFYMEERDQLKGVCRNSGVTLEAFTGEVKNRHYGSIKEI